MAKESLLKFLTSVVEIHKFLFLELAIFAGHGLRLCYEAWTYLPCESNPYQYQTYRLRVPLREVQSAVITLNSWQQGPTEMRLSKDARTVIFA